MSIVPPLPPLLPDELLLAELLLVLLPLPQPTAAKATALKAVIMVIRLIVFLSWMYSHGCSCPAAAEHTDRPGWASYACRSR